MFIVKSRDTPSNSRYAFKDIDNFIKSDSKSIFELYGQRRIGKTTLLSQINNKYSDKSLMIVIEENDTMQTLYEILDKNLNKDIFIIDEITKAEDFIFKSSKLYDYYSIELGKKIIISGTDSLSIDYANKEELSGRYIKKQIFPMPLNEYIDIMCNGKFTIESLRNYSILCGYFEEYPLNQPIKDIVSNITNSFEKYNYYTNKITNQRDSFELIIYKMLLVVRWEYLRTKFPGLRINKDNSNKLLSFLELSNKEIVTDVVMVDFITDSLLKLGLIYNLPDIKQNKSKNVIMNLKVKSLVDKALLEDEEYKQIYFRGEYFEDIMVYSSIVNSENKLYSLDWDNEIEFDLVVKKDNFLQLIDFKNNESIENIHLNKYFNNELLKEMVDKDTEFKYVYNGETSGQFQNSYEFLSRLNEKSNEGDLEWI